MRFNVVALAASVTFLMACGGGEKPADTSAAAPTPSVTDTAAAPATGGPAGGAAAAITGKTVEVRMVGDAQGYRFEPANVTIKAGDAVKWVMVSGAPHNVAFTDVPADAKAQLVANMPNQESGELSSRMFMNANESLTMSFGKVKPGTYNYNCTPHLAMGMKGTVTVQ